MTNKIYFYSHTISAKNPLERACFSQWFPSNFTDSQFCPDLKVFPNAETYMMYRKALLFEPEFAHQAFELGSDPGAVKAFGRAIKGFEKDVWDKECDEIVYRGNLLKFGQDERLKAALLATEGNLLVEASRNDRIWGIGFYANEAVGREAEWGENKLGKVLCRVRDTLKQQT